MTLFARHMAIPDLVSLARHAVQSALRRCADNPDLPCLAVVDSTCGNGHDTLFLAEAVSSLGGKPYGVFAFDVQPEALEATRTRLKNNGLTGSVCLLMKNHACLAEVLTQPESCPPSLAGAFARPQEGRASPVGRPIVVIPLRIAAAMYNLGFLPRSDKRIITTPADTLRSLKSAATAMAPQGILAIHAYGGHPGGLDELQAVDTWCSALPFSEWRAVRYSVCNKTRNPETLFLAEKIGT